MNADIDAASGIPFGTEPLVFFGADLEDLSVVTLISAYLVISCVSFSEDSSMKVIIIITALQTVICSHLIKACFHFQSSGMLPFRKLHKSTKMRR